MAQIFRGGGADGFMERPDLSPYRVLVLGTKPYGLHILCSVLAVAGVGRVIRVSDAGRALELLKKEQFNAVFCDQRAQTVNGRSFIVAARCTSTQNRMIPVFVLQERARRSDVERARDTGATDILTTPISPKTIARKLWAAIQKPRPFILADEFFGPDRRSKARAIYRGRDRRKRSVRKVKIDFAYI